MKTKIQFIAIFLNHQKQIAKTLGAQIEAEDNGFLNLQIVTILNEIIAINNPKPKANTFAIFQSASKHFDIGLYRITPNGTTEFINTIRKADYDQDYSEPTDKAIEKLPDFKDNYILTSGDISY